MLVALISKTSLSLFKYAHICFLWLKVSCKIFDKNGSVIEYLAYWDDKLCLG